MPALRSDQFSVSGLLFLTTIVAFIAATIRAVPSLWLYLGGILLWIAMIVLLMSPVMAAVYLVLALLWAEQRKNCLKCLLYCIGSFVGSGLVLAGVGGAYQLIF